MNEINQIESNSNRLSNRIIKDYKYKRVFRVNKIKLSSKTIKNLGIKPFKNLED